MNKTNDKKVCSFFASDYHFEMITLPYIEKELEKNKKIYILTDEDLTPTIKVLLSKMNLKDSKKKEILNIDWNKNYSNKLNQIEKTEEKMIIFIKGSEKFIKELRKDIDLCIGNKNFECIDCYDINEIGNDLIRITKNYDQVLNTMGKSVI